jgi:hypothetical protein
MEEEVHIEYAGGESIDADDVDWFLSSPEPHENRQILYMGSDPKELYPVSGHKVMMMRTSTHHRTSNRIHHRQHRLTEQRKVLWR